MYLDLFTARMVGISSAWAAFAGSFLVQSTVLIAAGLLVARFTRNASARATVYRVTLAMVVVCPLVSAGMGAAGWGAGWLHATQVAPPIVAPVSVAPEAVLTGAESGVGALAPQATPVLVAPAMPSYPLGRVVFAVAWGVVSLLLLGRLVRAAWHVRLLRQAARPASSVFQEACAELATEMGVAAPTVMVERSVTSPCLLGFARPAILLPQDDSGGAVERLRFALVHELAHLARHDCLWQLFGRVVRVGAYFQPLLYPLLRGLEDASDEVADDFVVMWSGADSGARTRYAAQLTSIAEHYVATTQLAGVGLMTFHSALGRRVQRVLDGTRPIALRLSRPAFVGIASVALVLTIVTALACSSPRAAAAGGALAKDSETRASSAPAPVEVRGSMDDPAAVGRWTSVDRVGAIEEFEPGKRQWKGDLSPLEVSVRPDGRISMVARSVKGLTVGPEHAGSPKYVLRTIDGARYLFLEWTFDEATVGKKASYYVLKYAGAPDQPAGAPAVADQPRGDQPPSFVDDPAVVGHWTSVDFVDAIDKFKPGKRQWKGDLFLKEISFLPGGKTSGLLLWSKGVTYDPGNKSQAKYQISEIDGVCYLFFEWVTDDVLARGRKAPFYVLRYAGSPKVEFPRVTESPYATQTGQSFVDDPAVIGQWTSVDLVEAMDQFTPGKPRWKHDLFLKSIAFMPEGRTSGPWLWSKGVAYDPNSKSEAKYRIREIDGTRYLFFEWITDDVLVRGRKAPFYVLKYSGTPAAPPADPRLAKSPYIAQAPPPFVDDPTVVGKWKTVDLVEAIEQFTPGKQRAANDELYVRSMEFMPNGRTSGPLQWSKGLTYHPGDKSKAAYVIRELSGARYLFLERVTGDVVLRGEKPLYYVMQYAGPSNAPAVAPTEPQGTKLDTARYVSKTAPVFADDPEVLGRWTCVDFVGEMGDYEPGEKKGPGDLYLKTLEFQPEGRLHAELAAQTDDTRKWSKGLVWCPDHTTLSKYTIKAMGDARYLFFEWVNGDVVVRGERPHYYVLKYTAQ